MMTMVMMMIIVVMMMMMNGSSCWYNQVPLLLAFITFSLRLRAPVKYILLLFYYIDCFILYDYIIYFRLRAPVKGPNARQNFFRMGSRFRFRSVVQNCIQIQSLSNVSTNHVNKVYRQLKLTNVIKFQWEN